MASHIGSRRSHDRSPDRPCLHAQYRPVTACSPVRPTVRQHISPAVVRPIVRATVTRPLVDRCAGRPSEHLVVRMAARPHVRPSTRSTVCPPARPHNRELDYNKDGLTHPYYNLIPDCAVNHACSANHEHVYV